MLKVIIPAALGNVENQSTVGCSGWEAVDGSWVQADPLIGVHTPPLVNSDPQATTSSLYVTSLVALEFEIVTLKRNNDTDSCMIAPVICAR